MVKKYALLSLAFVSISVVLCLDAMGDERATSDDSVTMTGAELDALAKEIENFHYDTPLHDAVKALDVESVQKLLDEGADPNQLGFGDHTALWRACRNETSNDPAGRERQHEIVRILYKAGGDDPKLMSSRDFGAVFFETLVIADYDLQQNVQRMHGPAFVKHYRADLIDHPLKSRIAIPAELRDIRFLDACFRGDDTQALEALYVGAHINAINSKGRSCLFDSDKHMIELWLRFGANPNIKDNEGETPLHCAVFRGLRDISVLLLQAKADVEAKDGKGKTPLHGAVAMKGNQQVVELLLEHGANAQEKDAYGRTPRQLAEMYGRKELLILLEKKKEKDSCILL